MVGSPQYVLCQSFLPCSSSKVLYYILLVVYLFYISEEAKSLWTCSSSSRIGQVLISSTRLFSLGLLGWISFSFCWFLCVHRSVFFLNIFTFLLQFTIFWSEMIWLFLLFNKKKPINQQKKQIGSFFMINLCLVVIATQFSETKKREMERMRLERARYQSTSTLASTSATSAP